MSEYDRMNEKTKPRPWMQAAELTDRLVIQSKHDAAFMIALANAADDIKRLWEAAEKVENPCTRCDDTGGPDVCGCSVYDAWYDLRKTREALRPLFGEVPE